jgi:hypothetical protein
VARRARMLRLPYQFVDNTREVWEKQADHSLDGNFKKDVYGAQFLMMGLENLKLLEAARNFDTRIPLYKVPEYVKGTTKEYVNDNNPIRYFVKECILRKRGEVIMLKDMLRRFKSWAKEYSGESRYEKWDSADLESALYKFGIKIIKNNVRGYHGFVLRDYVDDDDGVACNIEMSPSPKTQPQPAACQGSSSKRRKAAVDE